MRNVAVRINKTMYINESILDDWTPEKELTAAKKLSDSVVSEDELLEPDLQNFQIVLRFPTDDDVFTLQDAEPYIKRTYEYLKNNRNIKSFSKIKVIRDRFDLYVVGINHKFRRFDTVMLFIANMYVSLQAKIEGYNSFKVWIYTRKQKDDYAYRISEEYWFDNETIRYILKQEWNEIDRNHYVLDAAYRFLDDERHLPYQVIRPERVCKSVIVKAINNWEGNLGKMLANAYECVLGVPMKVHMMELYKLARINNYSYISIFYPASGTNTVSHLSIDEDNYYNDNSTIGNVQKFFDEHPIITDKIYFGEYDPGDGRTVLFAIVYLGSIPNLERSGKPSKGITRCGITCIKKAKMSETYGFETAIDELSTCVSRIFGDSGYVYEQFKKIADKRFGIKK